MEGSNTHKAVPCEQQVVVLSGLFHNHYYTYHKEVRNG